MHHRALRENMRALSTTTLGKSTEPRAFEYDRGQGESMAGASFLYTQKSVSPLSLAFLSP